MIGGTLGNKTDQLNYVVGNKDHTLQHDATTRNRHYNVIHFMANKTQDFQSCLPLCDNLKIDSLL